MHSGVIYAIIAAFAYGIWTVFHSQAANHISNLLGAVIVSMSAVIMGIIFFVLSPNKNNLLVWDNRGLIFAILAGIMALAIDYFVLKAYWSGLEISIAGPIIIGWSIAVAVFIGFFLGEPISLLKILGLILVIGGASLLAMNVK
ncbi:MAG: hypothetical protein ACD_4C00233G0007 [uncultured bacterium (gcode 4)]|uniref:EamA domain-containing protein n=1 Tax=uncultured bacterium (gcode 4) TaxID=1234023 RepID=K2F6B5_9BACT|nr:MAG: hypothetical protein ACD_4C00233G0007 [uncultured bacterium (gcode 4)]